MSIIQRSIAAFRAFAYHDELSLVRRTQLRDGDMLVVNVRRQVSEPQYKALTAALRQMQVERAQRGVHIDFMVLEGDVHVDVLGSEITGAKGEQA